MKPSTKRFLKVVIFGVIGILLAADSVRLFELISAFSRSECGFRDAISALRHVDAASRLADELAKGVRLVKSEEHLTLWDTPLGRIWTVRGEKTLPYLLAEQQRDVYEPPGHSVRPGDTVLDCGANIGSFTRTALTRGARVVVAIEPAPQTADALRRNFESEIQVGRVIVYQKGVWDRDAEMDLSIDETNEGSNSVVIGDKHARSVRVPLTTIDNIVDELKLDRVDFIKMDIEGAERRALDGAKKTIKRFVPRMSISSEHLPDDTAAIPAVIRGIESRYVHRTCDCVLRSGAVKALVLAFDVKR